MKRLRSVKELNGDIKYSHLSPTLKAYIHEMMGILLDELKEEIKDEHKIATKTLVGKMIASPVEQREELQKILLNTLHTSRAARIIRSYAKETIEHDKRKTLDQNSRDEKQPGQYYIDQIRELILEKFSDIQGNPMFCNGPFRILVLSSYLKQFADSEIVVEDKWNTQVYSAVKRWPAETAMIRPVQDRRGYWVLGTP
jgi:hypothetical protein